jgi:hypothetical protein
MTSTNPARLLGDLLSQANMVGVDFVRTASRQPAVEEVWQIVFGGEGVTIAREVIRMYRLPEEIREEFRIRQRSIGSIDHPLALVELGSQLPSGPWPTYWSTIRGGDALHVLDLASQLLDATPGEGEVPVDDVEGLRQRVGDLLLAVFESDLPEKVKRVVTDHLQDISEALTHQETHSTRTIWRRIWSFFGRLAVDPDLVKALLQSEVGRNVLVLLSSCLAAGSLSVSVTVGLKVDIELPKPDPEIVNLITPRPTPELEAGDPKELVAGTSDPDDGTPSEEG